MSQILQNFAKFQKCQLDNLVDCEKCCKTRIFLQTSVPIQPKTNNILPTLPKTGNYPTGRLGDAAQVQHVEPLEHPVSVQRCAPVARQRWNLFFSLARDGSTDGNGRIVIAAIFGCAPVKITNVALIAVVSLLSHEESAGKWRYNSHMLLIVFLLTRKSIVFEKGQQDHSIGIIF